MNRAKLQHILEYAKQQRHIGLHCKVPPEDMVEIVEAAILQGADGNSPVAKDCSFHTCRPVIFTDMRFVACPECGNKRCPHANDHRHACTGSNEPGQEGSAYPAAPKQEAK